MAFGNAVGRSIIVKKIEVGGAFNETPITVLPGDRFVFTVSNVAAENCSNGYCQVNVYYLEAGGVEHSSTGFIRLSFKATGLPQPTLTVSFTAPTPANASNVTDNWVFINASISNTPSTCVLEWNGTNYSMTVDALNKLCYVNRTGLADGIYSYYVWANDTTGLAGVSETRVVTVNTPVIYTYVASYSAAYGSVANFSNAQNASDSDAFARISEENVAGASQVVSNPDFNASSANWTRAVSGGCSWGTIRGGYSSGYGNPRGSIYAYAYGRNCGGAVNWTTSFNYSAGTPASVNLSFDRRVTSFSRGVAGANNFTFFLVKPSGAVVTIYPTTGFSAVDPAWVSVVDYSVPVSALNESGVYLLRIQTNLRTQYFFWPYVRVYFDNVRLSVKPFNYRYDVVFNTSGVPSGSSHELQVRYRVNGENALFYVFNGTAWNLAATLASASFATLNYSLSSAEYNSGNVLAKYVDASQAGDSTQNSVDVEYHRVKTTT